MEMGIGDRGLAWSETRREDLSISGKMLRMKLHISRVPIRLVDPKTDIWEEMHPIILTAVSFANTLVTRATVCTCDLLIELNRLQGCKATCVSRGWRIVFASLASEHDQCEVDPCQFRSPRRPVCR